MFPFANMITVDAYGDVVRLRFKDEIENGKEPVLVAGVVCSTANAEAFARYILEMIEKRKGMVPAPKGRQ